MMPTGNGDLDEKNMEILTNRNGEWGDERNMAKRSSNRAVSTAHSMGGVINMKIEPPKDEEKMET